ncbi:MAG: dephospho-CoA kinase [Muribaculaceae bacterium]|nr:dephospho-CoA kinase [Muribaculaceae bacterium]
MPLIALTGGIGCGKSVVARILGILGYEVYDCDSRAKALMDADSCIKTQIRETLCDKAVDANGNIDRRLLAEIVFSDQRKLEVLNGIVHSAVRKDLLNWHCGDKPAFVETAILYQSGLDRIVDAVWDVAAPPELRIERVMARNGLSRRQVIDRIEAQDSFEVLSPHPVVCSILNDGVMPVLPQVLSLLSSVRQ